MQNGAERVIRCSNVSPPQGLGCAAVHTIELTDDELRLVRAALNSYLEDFGHEEADVLRAIKSVLAKLPADG